MGAVFVHVSDIHFGQERDESLHIHDDVKQELIADAGRVVSQLASGVAQGILVTGDIAHSGERAQYDDAGIWLDALSKKIGCHQYRVQMVPGNHDLDRSKLSTGGEYLLKFIREGGAAEYEKVMANPSDRSTLLARFQDYERFSVAYDCALHEEAKFATNLRIEIGPHRWIRFIRLNSALLCTGKERDDEPELMIGSRQFTIPRNDGEENVVLVHHPLHWYKDSEDAQTYLRTRARVLISGHEHNPRVQIDQVDAETDVMMLAAGAAVPFKSNETFTYTYNVIEFDWDEKLDALVVTMHPRTWNAARTRFEADETRLGGKEPRFVLKSPGFKNGPPAAETSTQEKDVDGASQAPKPAFPVVELVAAETSMIDAESVRPPVEGYELTLLRFFRDLLESERLRVLVELQAIPPDWNERMTQGVERKLFDLLARNGRLSDVASMIDQLITIRTRVE
ncbi:metallophosphoesterase [Dyella sp.]|uniref:metallophosphoesterase n=1 Tax=Dyella sp. TaxID=1869338 RepID=UPI003F7DF2B9